MNLISLTLFCTLAPISLLAADPSLKPISSHLGKSTYAERWRILADLDGDGTDDMILSHSIEEFGTMGGTWTVYLTRNHSYVNVGEISAHPRAISIEPDRGRIHIEPKDKRHARIWVYLRSNGSSGSFGYYRIAEKSVDPLKRLEIYPGDGGTSLGNALYKATFNNSPIPIKLEHSTTDTAGKVTWRAQK